MRSADSPPKTHHASPAALPVQANVSKPNFVGPYRPPSPPKKRLRSGDNVAAPRAIPRAVSIPPQYPVNLINYTNLPLNLSSKFHLNLQLASPHSTADVEMPRHVSEPAAK